MFEVLGEAVAPVDVVWDYNEQSHEELTGDFVGLTMIAGPAPHNRMKARGTLLIPADDITVTVDSVVVGSRYAIKLNGFSYFTDAVGGDTVTTIRDRLLALIAADVLEPVTPTTVAADGILLTADFNGAMRRLTLVGSMSAGAPTLSTQPVLVTEGAQTMLVNIQAFSKGREPFNGAWALTAQCEAALQSEDLISKLRAFGVGVWDRGVVTDLSALTGAHWETRTSFDVTLAARASWVRSASFIDTISLTLNTFQVGGTLVDSTTISVTEP